MNSAISAFEECRCLVFTSVGRNTISAKFVHKNLQQVKSTTQLIAIVLKNTKERKKSNATKDVEQLDQKRKTEKNGGS